MMDLSVVTPSFNQIQYLQLCVASVADQTWGFFHYHVQDGASTDGTPTILEKGMFAGNGHTFTFASEHDGGIYDALNRGINRCLVAKDTESVDAERLNLQLPFSNSADSIIGWLNCDEQYLPGTLQKVADYFRKNPETDILFGGMLVIDETGELLSCRRAMPMRKVFLEASYLYNYSCAMFFRRSLWEKLGGFDTAYKNAGDEDLIRRALASGAKTAVLDEYLSVFTYGEGNLSSESSAVEEHRLLKQNNSGWVQLFRPVINAIRLGEKWIRGGHRQKGPIEYEIYVEGSVERKKFVCENPSCQWPGHTKPYMLHHRLDT